MKPMSLADSFMKSLIPQENEVYLPFKEQEDGCNDGKRMDLTEIFNDEGWSFMHV